MDLLKQLTADHRRFLMAVSTINSLLFADHNAYFTEGRKPEITGAVLQLLDEMIPSLVRHEEIERRVLFPILSERLPAMTDVMKEINTEHGNMLRLLSDFEFSLSKGKGVSNHRLIDKFLDLQKRMDLHLLREETEVFEPARANIPAEELASLEAKSNCRCEEAI